MKKKKQKIVSEKKLKPLTKKKTLHEIAEQLDSEFSPKDIARFLEATMQVAYKFAPKGGFVFPGLGKLLMRFREKRNGRNPATGESIVIPAKWVLKFRLAKAAKDAILGKPEKKKLKKKKKR